MWLKVRLAAIAAAVVLNNPSYGFDQGMKARMG